MTSSISTRWLAVPVAAIALMSVAVAQDAGKSPKGPRPHREFRESRLDRLSKKRPEMAAKVREFRNLTPEDRKARVEAFQKLSTEERKARAEQFMEANPDVKARRDKFMAEHPKAQEKIDKVRAMSPVERKAAMSELRETHPRLARKLHRMARRMLAMGAMMLGEK